MTTLHGYTASTGEKELLYNLWHSKARVEQICSDKHNLRQLLKQPHPDQSGSLERNAEILAAPANWTSRWKPPGEPHPTCKRHRGSQDLCQGHVQMCPGIGCRKFCSMTIWCNEAYPWVSGLEDDPRCANTETLSPHKAQRFQIHLQMVTTNDMLKTRYRFRVPNQSSGFRHRGWP